MDSVCPVHESIISRHGLYAHTVKLRVLERWQAYEVGHKQ